MFNIKEHDKSSVDKEELVNFQIASRTKTLGRELSKEETEKMHRFVDYLIESFVTRHFLLYNQEELLGWLGVMEVHSATVLIWEDHPTILADSEKKQIAQQLIQKSIDYARKKNIVNVRVFTTETEDRRPRYHELKEYFLQAGMRQTHTVLCMENQLTPDNLKSATIHQDYHVESMNQQDRQLLMDCYMTIFAQALDNFTNSLDSEEHKVWNFTLEAKMTEESIVIKKDEEIVAMNRVVDYGDFMELGPIGVIPAHRRKGLGKVVFLISSDWEKQKVI